MPEKTVKSILHNLAYHSENNNPVKLSLRDRLVNQALKDIQALLPPYDTNIESSLELDRKESGAFIVGWNAYRDKVMEMLR